MAFPENCLVITGRVARAAHVRCSPAGLPIARFTLEHHSSQSEADFEREARCRIAVMACGEALSRVAAKLTAGAPVRVQGFVSRADHRHGENRLVVHAKKIAPLDSLLDKFSPRFEV
jgi:primosomal replication protein N